MGSGSSRGTSTPKDGGRSNRGAGAGARAGPGTSGRGAVRSNGWEWFEINFSNMVLEPDDDEEDVMTTSDTAAGETPQGASTGEAAPPAPGTDAPAAVAPGSESAEAAPSDSANAGERDPAASKGEATEQAGDAAPAPTPAPAPAPAADLTNLPSLAVTGVDLQPLENALAHHTDDFEQDARGDPDLIVRRGQEFKMEVKLNRKLHPEVETLIIRFTANTRVPRPNNGTLISLLLNGRFEADEWSLKVESIEEKSVKLSIKTAPNALVSGYGLSILTKDLKSGVRREFAQKKKRVLVLFNPWCDQDNVFLDSDAERTEYVLNDTGLIWRGSYKNFHAKKWNFGQFDYDVREVVVQLLEENVKAQDRGNPIKVARVLSSVINDSGRGPTGVLVGNWSGEYDDGTRPTTWNGSVAILEEYKETGQPVMYGQCWVFSGLFTTFLRCLGIPARSVTNFASAHDTDDNMTIDKYVDIWGSDLKKGHDSVWNFHVWNEAWMARPDLEPGLGGWQAVDATPQEMSDGVFQCGPAPVIAVKRGLVNQGHDTRFIFAEVNADRVTWEVRRDRHNPNDPMSANFNHISLSQNSVGKSISTKQVGQDTRNDVTMEYKFPEGSAEERAAVTNAVNKGMSRGIYREDGIPDDVHFTIEDVSDVWIGDSFQVKIRTTSLSDKPRTVSLKTNIESCYYTGIALECIKKEKATFKIEAGASVETVIEIKADDYLDKIDEQGLLSVFVIGLVKETGKTVTQQDEVRLKIPDLEVTAEVQGSEVKLNITFTNRLSRELTECVFGVEAAKLVKPFSVKHGNIPASETITKELTFKARSKGRKEVLVEFDSQYLKDVTGSVIVDVTQV